MKFSTKTVAILSACLAVNTNAFSSPPTAFSLRSSQISHIPSMQTRAKAPVAPLFVAPDAPTEEVQDDIQHYKAMAAKLRAEAAALEAEQAQERADVAARAFQKFDKDNDGEIDIGELKAALEETFKLDVPDSRVSKLMETFDKSGDGKLQMDEFVGINQLRNQLDALARDEKAKALEASKAAEEEKAKAAMEAQLVELINDKPPTGTDKILSVLPYMLPLLDGLSFGQFLLEGAGGNTNPVVNALATAFVVYRSIPLGGLLAYFALSSQSRNLSVNRLVRFNMQQAIFTDIALFVPGLLATLTTAAAPALGVEIPPGLGELGSDAVFIALLATIGYSSISSLLGETPDKVPFLSDAVNSRTPSMQDFLDEDGKFDPSKMMELPPRDEKDESNRKD